MTSTRNGDTQPAASSGGPGEEADSTRPKVRLPLALSKLPPGRHNLPREVVIENQRTRLLAAALTVFGQRGFAGTSIADLIKEAGTSRGTFYSLFPNKAACFLATYEIAIEWLDAAAREAVEGADTWPLQVRAATGEVISLLAKNPELARLCVIEVHFAGDEVQARRRALVDRIAGGLRVGRKESPDGKRLTALLEPALVYGATSVIARTIADGDAGALSALAPQLTELFLTAYLGPAEARRIARRRK